MQNHAMFYRKVSWQSKYFLVSCTFPRFQFSGGLVWNALGFLYSMNFLDLWTFCWFYVATNIIDSRHSCALFRGTVTYPFSESVEISIGGQWYPLGGSSAEILRLRDAGFTRFDMTSNGKRYHFDLETRQKLSLLTLDFRSMFGGVSVCVLNNLMSLSL